MAKKTKEQEESTQEASSASQPFKSIGYVVELYKDNDDMGREVTRVRHKVVSLTHDVADIKPEQVLIETSSAADVILALQQELGRMLMVERAKLD